MQSARRPGRSGAGWRRRWPPAALAGAAALAVCAAVVAGAAVASWSRPGPGSPAASPSSEPSPASTSPSPAATDGEPGPAEPTSGPLSASDVLAPQDLGKGWRLKPLEDDVEAGTMANGTAYARRDVDEVLALSVPLGCEQRSTLPRPRYVLEGNLELSSAGVRAVTLAMQFGTATQSRDFLARRWADLEACRTQGRDPITGARPPVSALRPDRTAGDVSQRSDPFLPADEAAWVEVFVGSGARVTAVAINLPLDSPDLPDLRTVADRLSAAGG